MRRLPIRVRVAAAFAVAMAAVLAATGLFVYTRLGDDLNAALDQDLRLRAQDLSALVTEPGRTLARDSSGRLVERGESFAQLLDRSGRVLDATPPLDGHPLLRGAALRATGTRFFDRPSVPGLDEGARLLATPVTHDGRPLVLVVGATRENRAEALASLRTELLIAGPIALLIATGLGYLLAGAGLRAVEAMRRRARTISAETPGERLPVPQTGDELQRLGETLNAMLARLEEALEREQVFVAEAGHELRTPLALLRGELDLALRHAESAAELREALRAASDETDRLTQLAADLLLIASAEGGKVRLRLERVPARDVLDSVRNRFAWRAEADARPLDVVAPDDLAITADRVRLEQALGNLVENALRHGGGAVTLGARRSTDAVELSVRDEGAGFPPAFLPHAFQRFTRTDETRTGGGAGLGLAIVDVVARAHGGGVAAANAPGGGGEVRIVLPEPARPSAPRERPRPRAGRSAPRTPAPR